MQVCRLIRRCLQTGCTLTYAQDHRFILFNWIEHSVLRKAVRFYPHSFEETEVEEVEIVALFTETCSCSTCAATFIFERKNY